MTSHDRERTMCLRPVISTMVGLTRSQCRFWV